MRYLLDTNIFISYSRKGVTSDRIERKYHLLRGDTELFVSIVTLGELDSFIKQNQIGLRKQSLINDLLNRCFQIDLNHQEIISKYGDIDAFSQGKVRIPGHHFSARNMGKNDLWIAATASHYQLTLRTTDQDF